jgi:hypothetical protein
MSALSRRKGAAFQAELARRWRENGLYPDAHSTQGAQKSGGYKPASDVDGTPFVVEAKHCRAINILAALRQARAAAEAAKDNRTILAVTRYHGTGVADAIVSMSLADFEALIRAQREGWDAP